MSFWETPFGLGSEGKPPNFGFPKFGRRGAAYLEPVGIAIGVGLSDTSFLHPTQND